MNFKKLYLLLYKYLRLQNTRYVSLFEYLLEVSKEFPKIDGINIFLKTEDGLNRFPVLGDIQDKNLIDETKALDELSYIYVDNNKKYLFSHKIGDIFAKVVPLKIKYERNKIIIPIYIEQKEQEPIKIGVICFYGKDLTLEKTKQRIANIRDTMIFLATIFSSISQMIYNRFDKLTSMITRKEFDFEIQELLLKKPKRLCVLMLDIDYFKKVNDTYGHDTGDLVLRQMSQRILTKIRTIDRKNNPRDISVRWGGEEFVIILSNANLKIANKVTNRIRDAIISKPFFISSNIKIPVTCSFGLVCSNQIEIEKLNEKNIMHLITLADKALYEAKNTGRNKICVYGEKQQQKLELK